MKGHHNDVKEERQVKNRFPCSLIEFIEVRMQTRTDRLYSLLKILLLAMFFAVLALIVLAQANPGTHSIHRDAGFYIYFGDQLLHGKTLYRDVWDHKPPAIYYLNAIALWIGQGSRWGVWLLEFIFLFTAIVFSHLALKRIWGTAAALAGTLLWLYGLEFTLEGGNLTEEYPLALHFISILLFFRLLEQPSRRGMQFLLGLLLAGTFLFRPNIAAIQIMMILVLLVAAWTQKRSRDILPLLLWTGAGAALPILFVVGYFWSRGLFGELMDAVFTYNFAYSQLPLHQASRLVAGFNLLGNVARLSLAGYIASLWLFIKEKQNRFIYSFILLSVPIMLYVNDPATRLYPHYYMSLLPLIALLGAALWHLPGSWIASRLRLSHLHEIAGYSILIAVAMLYLFRSERAQGYINAYIGYTTDEQWMVEETSRIANHVRSITHPGDVVLFWGAYPDKNFLSGREAPTRALFYPLYVDSSISRKLNEDFLHDLVAHPPVLIVDLSDPAEVPSLDREKRGQQLDGGFTLLYTPQNLQQVFEFIEQNYTLFEVVGGKPIYKLNSSP